jgi:hypothetical protein
MKTPIYLVGLMLLVVTACKQGEPTLFTLLDNDETGIQFRNELYEGDELNVMNYSYFYNGAGVSVGDINNDGLVDIFFTGNMVKNRLYLNKGNFKFENITDKSGVAQKQGWCTGTTMVDINSDGKLDIYICRSADGDPARRKNLLFINNGDLTFTEKADEYGLADDGYSTNAAFFDYDKDGDLDMFLINHSLQQYAGAAQQMTTLRGQKNPNFASKLYRNDNGHFKNVSDSAGITSNVLSFGLGLAISDVNQDGWPDINVSNDFNEPDYLFINNRNGTFTDKLSECMDHISLFSMGSDFADYNNDGRPDLITVDMLPEDNATQKMHSGAENFDKMQMLFKRGFYYQFSRNMLHKNNGDGTFSEVANLAGVSNTDWSWAPLFADFDNDGYKDLFVSNGYVKDYTEMDFLKYTVDETVKAQLAKKEVAVNEMITKMPTIEISSYMFHNRGDGTFEKRTKEWGFDKRGVSSGSAYVDLDNDGDLDLVVNKSNDFAGIYMNNAESMLKNNFVKIALKGNAKNPWAIGSKVTLHCKNDIFFQEQQPVRGYQSSVDPNLVFGIGKHNTVDSVVVVWPDDKIQVLRNVQANKTIVVTPDAGQQVGISAQANNVDVMFSKDPQTQLFVHHEDNFNDFNVQLLLPNYLSRQGPCMAKADVNNDGREDVFIGGAKGSPSSILIQKDDGSFVSKPQASLSKDSLFEDVEAVFFDADGDKDPDLFVGSAGYELVNDSMLQSRLYINDKGVFRKKPGAVPKLQAGVGSVKAADIDGDGDIDLFVGSRVVPGKYPLSPDSKLLLNNGQGEFTDHTSQIAPSLAKVGMVTDAVWADINKDGTQDLIVVGEWMPVKVFINRNGTLTDESSAFIKFPSTGWWNSVFADDFDADGDMDLVIGNLGENAQMHASQNEPVTVYYKDFDNNGSIDPIVCYYINGKSYPAASRDDLMDQLPALKKKFLTYKSYSTATIEDIFSSDELQDAGALKAEMLRTIYLENKGGSFELKELPVEAQYSPVYAIASIDANHDGKKDIVLAGKNVWTRIKFGRYDANHGILLSGDGKNNFKYVPQYESGLNVRGDVRCLEIIHSKGKEKLLFGLNDAALQIYEVGHQKK